MNGLFKMLDNAADGAFVINNEQHIIYWNNAAREILGYTANDVMGQPCYKILRGCDDRGQVLCHHSCDVSVNAPTGKSIDNYNLATRTKNGEMRWINVSILTASHPEDGDTPVVIHLFRDATQSKQNEQFIHQMFDAVERWQKVAAPPISEPGPNVEELTEREREVLVLLAQGHSTNNIALSLSISPATVRNHIQNILHKLNVHSRVEAVAYAFEHELMLKD